MEKESVCNDEIFTINDNDSDDNERHNVDIESWWQGFSFIELVLDVLLSPTMALTEGDN